MLDREATAVNGFKYKKAEAEVIAKPQHLRIGTKDYLLFALKNGKLKILNRQGDDRIRVKETFQFSNEPFFVENSNFKFIDTKGSIFLISQSGKVTGSKSAAKTEIYYDQSGDTQVSLNGNMLTINGIKKELDLGIYKGLQVYNLANSSFITLTNLQDNKVYVYTKKGDLVPNFPVYASSEVALGSSGKDQKLLLTCKGESDSVLIYQINL